MSKHFSLQEMACPCCNNSDIDPGLYEFLETVRTHYGKPMRVTSGKRCAVHNIKIGGSTYSAHLTGQAADIACADSDDKYALVAAAIAAGAEGIGVYTKHVHMDIKTEHRQNKVLWRG